MKTLRNLVFILCLFTATSFMSSCTILEGFSEVDALNQAQPVGTPFTQALSEEYRNFANSELKDMLDYPDALHFARKGLSSSAGDIVLPEPIEDWNLMQQQIVELTEMRGRLVNVLNYGAREQAPVLAARAQARFDCWIEQEEENYAEKFVRPCRDEFMQALAELEAMVRQPAPAAPAPAPVMEPVRAIDMAPSEPLAPEDAVYIVFFNWDSSELDSTALSVIDSVVAEYNINTPNTVRVVGHTDTSGSKQYNKRLALRRATAVKNAFAERGVDPAKVRIDGRGENELLVSTPDNIREPANRRANISFQ